MTDSAPTSLVLYQHADAASAVLRSGCLPWVAPHARNDPFALDADSAPDFDGEALADGAARAIAKAVFSREPPGGLPGHPITRVLQRWRAQRRFNAEEEVFNALGVVLPALVERHMEQVQQIRVDWRAFAERVRLLSLHERHTDIAHWERRADHHRGIALRLRCEEGDTLAGARPALYQPRRPQVTTLTEQTAVLVGQSRTVAQEHFRERLLARPRAAAEEREWCALTESDTVAPPGDGDGVEQRPFVAEELRAVYLGARFPEAERQRLLVLLAERYPHARVLEARLHPRDYALEFDPLHEPAAEEEGADAEAAEAAPAA